MNDLRRIAPAQIAMLVLAALIAVAGTALYLSAERPYGDRRLARLAVLDLSIPAESIGSAEASRTAYSAELDDRHAFIDLYLHSASAERLPAVTVHAQRAWRCYLVADQMWRIAEAGEPQPLVADVYGADALLTDVPDLAALRVGVGAEARLDNRDLAFVRALFAAAAAERDAAADALAEAEQAASQ